MEKICIILGKNEKCTQNLDQKHQERRSIATGTYFGYFSIKLFFRLTTVMIHH
jgi:hypothetical protein